MGNHWLCQYSKKEYSSFDFSTKYYKKIWTRRWFYYNLNIINSIGKVSLNAIASRDLKKAESYVDQLKRLGIIPSDQVVKLFGTYDDLINDPDIDAVYIPLPTTLHLEVLI